MLLQTLRVGDTNKISTIKMRISTTFLLFGALFGICCNAWTLKPYQNFNGRERENKLVDTFSLSFYGNLGMSRAVSGISKIVEGIVSCKYFAFLFKFYPPREFFYHAAMLCRFTIYLIFFIAVKIKIISSFKNKSVFFVCLEI